MKTLISLIISIFVVLFLYEILQTVRANILTVYYFVVALWLIVFVGFLMVWSILKLRGGSKNSKEIRKRKVVNMRKPHFKTFESGMLIEFLKEDLYETPTQKQVSIYDIIEQQTKSKSLKNKNF